MNIQPIRTKQPARHANRLELQFAATDRAIDPIDGDRHLHAGFARRGARTRCDRNQHRVKPPLARACQATKPFVHVCASRIASHARRISSGVAGALSDGEDR